MEVEFGDRQLERCYLKRSDANRIWGPVVGAKFGRTIDAIYNASNRQELASIRSLRLHPLHGLRAGQWAVDLNDRWRVILLFNDDSVTIVEVTQHYGD